MLMAFCIDESCHPHLLMIFCTTCSFSPPPYSFFFPIEIYLPLIFFHVAHLPLLCCCERLFQLELGGMDGPRALLAARCCPKDSARGQCCVAGRGVLLSFPQWGTSAFRETMQLGLKLKWAFCHSTVIPLGCPQGLLGLLPSACCRARGLMSARFGFVQHSLPAPESWPFVLQGRGAEGDWLHSA